MSLQMTKQSFVPSPEEAITAHLADYLERKGVVLHWPDNVELPRTIHNAWQADNLTPEISTYWGAMNNAIYIIEGKTLCYRYCRCGRQFQVDTGPGGYFYCPECPDEPCDASDPCGGFNGYEKSCKHWKSLDTMAFADIKAIFAASDLSLGTPVKVSPQIDESEK